MDHRTVYLGYTAPYPVLYSLQVISRCHFKQFHSISLTGYYQTTAFNLTGFQGLPPPSCAIMRNKNTMREAARGRWANSWQSMWTPLPISTIIRKLAQPSFKTSVHKYGHFVTEARNLKRLCASPPLFQKVFMVPEAEWHDSYIINLRNSCKPR